MISKGFKWERKGNTVLRFAGSDGAVFSRSVTSCAGMTAYLVLLAQTRVGFLSGGCGTSFHQLTQQEQKAQKEEAFARATVALTRAQQLCIIMGRSFCMPSERLRLCCGIQCTDSLHPNGLSQRRKLFTAALKLLWFAVGIETDCCENEGTKGPATGPLATSPTREWTRSGDFECNCSGPVKTHRISHQRSVWGRKNSFSSC